MEQLTLFDENNTQANNDNIFSGCHRYRECSDAKKCLISDNSDSVNCVYRQNIENGNIFIGKNANSFDRHRYDEINSVYLSLDATHKYELNCILVYYQKFRSSFLWYNSDVLNDLSRLGFIYLRKDNEILNKCSMSFLRSLSPKKFRKRELLMKFLKENDITAVNDFIDRFRFVFINPDMSRYMFELYHDHLLHLDDEYKKNLPLIDNTIFMK